MVGACVSSDPDVEIALSSLSPGDDSCPTNSCGNGNSPVIAGTYFYRLHIGTVPGTANPEGVKIVSARSVSGTPMRLTLMNGDRLVGQEVGGLGIVAQNLGLVGTRIDLSVGGQSYQLRITAVALADELFWPSFAAAVPIEAYDFEYRQIAEGAPDTWTPLCAEGAGDSSKVRALVFGGDLYNPVTKAITVGLATHGWMNIACTGSATYKMHKIAHTTAAQARLGAPTTLAQRRTMLNAWTSNVCGTGQAFTEQGEPITLREALGWLPLTSPYREPSETYEAIWNENGAVCLDVHRREAEEPGISNQLKTVTCGRVIPSCTELPGLWTTHGGVWTGSPFPKPKP